MLFRKIISLASFKFPIQVVSKFPVDDLIYTLERNLLNWQKLKSILKRKSTSVRMITSWNTFCDNN